jgi:hypothetical protein
MRLIDRRVSMNQSSVWLPPGARNWLPRRVPYARKYQSPWMRPIISTWRSKSSEYVEEPVNTTPQRPMSPRDVSRVSSSDSRSRSRAGVGQERFDGALQSWCPFGRVKNPGDVGRVGEPLVPDVHGIKNEHQYGPGSVGGLGEF